MTVYIVCYRGTIYGVYDTREKAAASEYVMMMYNLLVTKGTK